MTEQKEPHTSNPEETFFRAAEDYVDFMNAAPPVISAAEMNTMDRHYTCIAKNFRQHPAHALHKARRIYDKAKQVLSAANFPEDSPVGQEVMGYHTALVKYALAQDAVNEPAQESVSATSPRR